MVDRAEERTVVMSGQSAVEATQVGGTLECPVCHTASPAFETWCAECGFRLADTPGNVPDVTAPPGRLAALSDGRELALKSGVNRVGRESADVLLSDPSVSRQHAIIRLEDGSATVEDQNSTNGTFLAGVRIPPGEPQPIRSGQEVRFGEVGCRLEVDGVPAESETDEPADEPDLVSGPWLESDEGARFSLTVGELVVGRRSANALVVADPFTSGRHARLLWDGAALLVEDLDSTNGTLLNGERLEPSDPTALRDGDRVTFGRQTWTVHGLPNRPLEPDVALEEPEEPEGE